MREYYYLVATLPLLEFGMRMPISYEDFLSSCREQLSSKDFEIIKRTNIAPTEEAKDPCFTLRQWKGFDITLRNELSRYRASKKSKDTAAYIRGEDYLDPILATEAHWAINEKSPLEAERFLDRFRWERIEELEREHYFDIDYLIAYALKLQILRRWQRIVDSEGGRRVLQDLVRA